MTTLGILGYVMCGQCQAAVLREVSYKTNGLCADCFRAEAGKVLDAAMVVVSGRERIVLRSKRSPTELAQRARARKRSKAKPAVKVRSAQSAQCAERARRRLAKLFPELYEVLLADERAAAGLNAWTIDRCLTPGQASSTMEMIKAYHALEEAS